MTRLLRAAALALPLLLAAAGPTAADGPSVPALIDQAAADFGASAPHMRKLAWCESRMDPFAVNRWSGAAGVFQWMPASWRWASVQAGYGGASRFDATANVRTAAWLLAQPGGARHWVSCL